MQTTIQYFQELDLLQFAGMHLRHAEELARATGQHFNIFNVLGIGHYEVTTHSPILAELLNPDGLHSQGDIFLRLFVSDRHLNVSGFGAGKTTVEMNYNAGPVTECSGGLIDIVIKNDRGSVIAIENKIYAVDGENQMKRYRGSLPEARLFYLTLDGKEPSNLLPDELKRIACECLSYKDQIIPWLEDCRKEAACLPTVRETITQYIHLIKELNNQSILMNGELIKEIIGDKEKLKTFFALTAGQDSVRQELFSRLDKQLDAIAAELKLKRDGSMQNGSCSFIPEGLELKNFQIAFEFESGGLFFGFKKKDKDQHSQIGQQHFALIRELFPEFKPKVSVWWPAWDWFESRYRYWNAEAALAIVSGRFGENLKVKLETMVKIANRISKSSNQQ